MKFSDIKQFTKDGDYQCDYPMDSFIEAIDEMVKTQGLQLNPDFQRGNVWSAEQQSRYIEFILKGGRTARIIYLNNPSWKSSVPVGAYNDFVCVDGLQRITAIRSFINNEVKAFGLYYKEYEGHLDVIRHNIKLNVNDLKTKREVLQWYIDFNSGGTIHSNEEINRVKALLDQECK